METVLLADVTGFGTAEQEHDLLLALDPDTSDDRLDALLAAGWKIEYLRRDFKLVPPGLSPGAARRGLG
jgi:hypothetical protein